jgi:hypothetical protein
MLDERLDPWESEEMVREIQKKQVFREKVGVLLKGRQPLLTEAST